VRWRLTLTVVAVVGLALLGGGLLLVNWVEATLLNDVRTRNAVALESMSEALGNGQLPTELLLSQRNLERRLQDTSTGSENLGELLSTTWFFADGPIFQQAGVRYLVDNAGRVMLFGRSGLPADLGGYVEVTRDIETTKGRMTLHAVTPRGDIDRSVRALSGALVLGLPLLVVAAGAMTWAIAGRTLAPVASITRRVRELSATTLDARVPVPDSGDEITELAITMNEMLERLHRSSVAQRQFLSDASHELRSPVASIRAQLETALRYPDEVDWPSLARVVLAEDERLDHLVGNLLTMARLDEGRMGPRAEVDVEDLVMAQAARLRGVGDVAVDVSGVSAGRVWGNAGELTSVVRNLVDNGVRHGRSRVVVTLRDAGPWVVLTVADDGAGVPADQRDRVFERFARLDEGRERDAGGAGLGLALSRRIVEHHGGRISVTDGPLGGAQFVVSLPSATWVGRTSDPDDADPDAAGPDDAAGSDDAIGPDDAIGAEGADGPDGATRPSGPTSQPGMRPASTPAAIAASSWPSTMSSPASQKPGSARSQSTMRPSSSGGIDPPAESSSR
jgi:signal transduction histidine kinase